MDLSGVYVVCLYLDRCMCIYNFIIGEFLVEVLGYVEVIIGVIFFFDCWCFIFVSILN